MRHNSRKKIRRGLWTFIPIELIYCQIIYALWLFQFVPTTLAIFYCLFISGPQTNRYELFVSFLFGLLDKSKQYKDSPKFFPVSFCALFIAMVIVGVYAIFHKFLFVPESVRGWREFTSMNNRNNVIFSNTLWGSFKKICKGLPKKVNGSEEGSGS